MTPPERVEERSDRRLLANRGLEAASRVGESGREAAALPLAVRHPGAADVEIILQIIAPRVLRQTHQTVLDADRQRAGPRRQRGVGAVARAGLDLAPADRLLGHVARHVDEALASRGIHDAPVFIVPTPFNTLVWRIVVLTERGYLEGFDSLPARNRSIEFSAYDSDGQALLDARGVWAVSRLRWFARDFVKASVVDDRLLITDLRMGQEPIYVFTHVAAVRGNPHWEPTPTERISPAIDERILLDAWRRMWTH